mmetsp:Transcript_36906/g.60751  ORF Transcript_36906/g.60751 Transcript_36906/m.60751 type:complete len:96 (-) Transcript_36906:27-314(-)
MVVGFFLLLPCNDGEDAEDEIFLFVMPFDFDLEVGIGLAGVVDFADLPFSVFFLDEIGFALDLTTTDPFVIVHAIDVLYYSSTTAINGQSAAFIV